MVILKKATLLIALALSIAINLFANSKSENLPLINDSIRLDDIIVTGSMPKVNLRNVPMSITVVSSKTIESRHETSLLPMLTEEIPGLFITQRGVAGYGVSNGSAGSMNIRGVGGAPTAGVLILIDGHPQYMGLMGHPLADSYQSMSTERVEVVRGPASVLYGSNAMGGVINIISKKQYAEGFKGGAKVMYGSYNTLSSEVQAGWKKDRFFAMTNIGYNRSDGHRDNMEFEQFNGFFKTGYNFNSNWSAFYDLSISKTESSNPGTVSSPILDNDADITRGVISVVLENEYEKTSGALKFFSNYGDHWINDGYAPGGTPREERYKSKDQMQGFTAYQSYKLFQGNNTTAGFDFHRFGGKAWQNYPNPDNNVELADIHVNEYAGYLNTQQTLPGNKVTLNAGVRLNKHELNGSEWIPQFGISYTPTATNTFKAIVSKGYRNPTIRELYMFPPRNPDLLPERMMNYEISYLQSLLDNKISLGLNLFYINGSNMIQTIMVEGKLSNVNIGKIENKGLEITSSYKATGSLSFSANYSYLNMKHKILASPEHKLYISGNYVLDRWSFSSGVQYVGNIYTTVNPDPVKESYFLWNARANVKINNIVSLFLKGENLLNQKYEINAGFPMPETTVFGGFQLNI